ncbi:MAG: hypothetical protein JNL85_15650 [Rubrivivax sp.]|nr:hypothetical protein [Rubrivivax sp.]
MALPLAHRRRLRELWRSAGWPCRDAIEVDLLAAGLLERRFDGEQRETLHLTEAGIRTLALTLAKNRAAFDAHEALVARVAEQMQRAGRIVWRGLALRAPLALPQPQPSTPASPPAAASPRSAPAGEGPGPSALIDAPAAAAAAARPRWVMAMPDVYSIRHTTVEAFTEPAVHEIKVRRGDLLADLAKPDKGAAYRALASQCWYVLGPGVGSADDVPPEYGVLIDDGRALQLARPAPRRALTPAFPVWMALARATAEPPPEDSAQALLAARRET